MHTTRYLFFAMLGLWFGWITAAVAFWLLMDTDFGWYLPIGAVLGAALSLGNLAGACSGEVKFNKTKLDHRCPTEE
jgi:hypothetical protein